MPKRQSEHGIRFAPAALARCFAFENEAPRGGEFGFHGPYNLPRVLDEATLWQVIEQLPDEFFRGRDARRLARSLLGHRMPVAAGRLLARRRADGLEDNKTRLLPMMADSMAALHLGRA